jgi:hypothetical protein
MFYCKEYSDENAARLVKSIEETKELDVCYENNPLIPVLVPLFRILAEPHIYKRYKSPNSKADLI